jgi:predicted NBD/HSP70 family sugar kinase
MTGKPQVLKQVNTALITDTLGKLGTATRVELSEHTGLSQPTVNTIIENLLSIGTIRNMGLANSRGGRRAQTFSIDPDYSCVILLALRPEDLHVCIINASGQILDQRCIELLSPDHVLEALHKILLAEIKQKPSVKAVGIGVPGAVSQSGIVFAIPQFPLLEEMPLQTELTKTYGLPVLVENDINSIALGYCNNPGSNTQDIVHIHIGKGIGSGIVIGNQIIRGFSSFAGEIGYMIVKDNSKSLGCGGPFESQYLKANTQDEKTDVISRLIINIICILNPPLLVFSGSGSNSILLNSIRSCCENSIPASAIPGFQLIVDETRYYFGGLFQLVRRTLDTDIKLVSPMAC